MSKSPEETFGTPEYGKAAVAKREARRAEKRALLESEPETYMREFFREDRARLAKELMDAAFGRGRYDDLPSDKRLSALFKALEYSIGKPPPAAKSAPPPEPEKPAEPAGITFT